MPFPLRLVQLFIICVLLFTGEKIVRAQPADTDSVRRMKENEQVISLIHQGNNFSKNNFDTAILILKNAYSQSKQNDYYDGMFHAAISIAIAYSEAGLYHDALEWFQITLACSSKTSHIFRNSSRTLHNIGSIFMYQGNYKEALVFFFKAAQLAEQRAGVDNEVADHLVRIYNNIGAALLQMDDPGRALYYLDKAEILAKRLHLPERMANVLNNKAKAAYRQGDTRQAWKYIHQALTLARRFGPSRVEYTASQTIAEMLNNQGKSEKAIPYLKTALERMQHVNQYYRSGMLYTLGNSYFLLRDYPEAALWLQAAFHEATAVHATEYLLLSHQKLAALYARTKNYQQAFTHQQAAYLLNDSLLNKEKAKAVDLLEIKYRTAEKDKEIIRKQLLISEQQNYLKQKNIWIYSISGGTLFLALLAFSYCRTSRQKQKINLLKAMIQGEERERTRIGQELHDGIGGRIAAINMNFGAVQKRYNAFDGREELEQIMNMMEETSEEVRKTAHNLIPDVLSRYSFPEAIRLYCEQISTEDLRIQVQIQDIPTELPDKTVELILYRIIQELVQNIVKHAKASEAVIEISQHEKTLSIIAEDNGNGFNTQEQQKGIGLHNIRSRVKMLQGNITIESAKGIGTSISIHFDTRKLKTLLPNEHQDRHNG